jgi:hypothetical protein
MTPFYHKETELSRASLTCQRKLAIVAADGRRRYLATVRKMAIESGNSSARKFTIDKRVDCTYIQALKRRFHAKEGCEEGKT